MKLGLVLVLWGVLALWLSYSIGYYKGVKAEAESVHALMSGGIMVWP